MNNLVLLEKTAEASQTTGGSAGQLIMVIAQIAILGALFYFILIRPQKKQQKQLNALLATIAAGDSVVTSGGFYGVVIDVMEDIVIVEFGNNKNCRIPMKKAAIVELEKPNTAKE
jgi:preprotein translocase subunit YajC